FPCTLRRPPRPPLFPYTTLFRSHAHGHPLAVAAQHPVAHVVDGGVGGGGGRGQAARLDDGGAALAHGGDEGVGVPVLVVDRLGEDRKSTRLNSSHVKISYAVFCL